MVTISWETPHLSFFHIINNTIKHLYSERNVDEISKKLVDAKNRGKTHFIVVVAEGVGDSENIAKIIEQKTGIESRATILGHVQRGGSPTVDFDIQEALSMSKPFDDEIYKAVISTAFWFLINN